VLVGLDWQEYVVSDRELRRPMDLAVSQGNPSKAILVPRGYANKRLGWVAKHKIADIVSPIVTSASSKYMKIFSSK
jgi:GDPmannose 4,6-dehydratase